MQRIFIALKINVSEELAAVYASLKHKLSNEKIKWVPLENIHITLRFIGEIPEESVQKICSHLCPAHDFTHVRIEFSGIGIFGSSYNPRVIWLGIKTNTDITAVAMQLQQQLEQIGFLPDRQNFVPHLTLARINHLNDKNYFNEILSSYKHIKVPPQTPDGYYVVESKLLPGGPQYSYLKKFPFEARKK